MSLQKVDVLVIGGGIIGACVAREIQAQGRQVTLIEKGSIGTGCSYANAGWITPCFAMPLPQPGMFLKSIGWLLDSESPLHIQPQLSPTLVRWMYHFLMAMNQKTMERSITALTEISKYSLNFYREFAARSPSQIGFENRGLLLVSATDDGMKYAQTEHDVMQARGIAGRTLSKEELLHLEPALKPIVKGGFLFPDEAQVEPYPTTQAVMDEFVKLGGISQAQTEVYDFEIRNKKIEVIKTTQGNFSADLVVLAAGSWSTAIAKQLGARIPILGGKGYSMNIKTGAHKPQKPIMIVEKKIAITPRANSIRVAGTLELVNQDFSISPTRLNGIYKGAQEYLHLDGSSEPTEIWRGLRPCTPDGVPVIGSSDRLSNLFYCMGHQLLGLQSAPGSAKLASELIFGQTPMTDPAPFRASRFE